MLLFFFSCFMSRLGRRLICQAPTYNGWCRSSQTITDDCKRPSYWVPQTALILCGSGSVSLPLDSPDTFFTISFGVSIGENMIECRGFVTHIYFFKKDACALGILIPFWYFSRNQKHGIGCQGLFLLYNQPPSLNPPLALPPPTLSPSSGFPFFRFSFFPFFLFSSWLQPGFFHPSINWIKVLNVTHTNNCRWRGAKYVTGSLT